MKTADKKREIKQMKRQSANDVQLVIMASAAVCWLFVFSYLPMAGTLLSFKEGNKAINIFNALLRGSWTLDNYRMLFLDETFWQVFFNTVKLNLLMLLFNFPMPIIFALLLNEMKFKKFKSAVQTICNFPHFISWVVYGGIILMLTDSSTGVINPILEAIGLSSPENPVNLNEPQYFYAKIIIVTIIKGVGWGSIIYMAAIAGIDPMLYDAAEIDGANRMHCALKITLPSIRPTIIVLFLLNISSLLGNSFEQFYVFQTTSNIEKTRVLATYIYSLGFTYRNYSTATALSLFEGLISMTLLLTSNALAKRLTGEGIY